jgi:hypothetical protein
LDYEAPTVNIQVSVQGLWFLDLRRHLRLFAQKFTAAGTLQPCVANHLLTAMGPGRLSCSLHQLISNNIT